ncbi:STAS domain-containing protein [Spirillospora sp. NPDC048911]|uniref:STAS domain-containing protein n=1 Tax=Spirillospora sp. NPDC048911 TaxID=3364527 RepID=UPI00371B6077
MTMTTTPATKSGRHLGYGGFTAARRPQAAGKPQAARRPRAAGKSVLPAHRRPGHTIVALHGDLDIASAPALRVLLIGALHHSAGLLTIDLGEVAFCDAAGLAVLIGAQRRATGLGVSLRLANPRPQVTKLLGITGLDRVLTIVHPTLHPLSAGPDRRGEPAGRIP